MALHGHTKIELFDAKTGELLKTKHENNMFTNYLRDAFACRPGLYAGSAFSASIGVEKLTRGIMLFDTALDEDADKYIVSTQAKMVANAGPIAYAGNDLGMGSYNENLSDVSGETQKTYVWDWDAEHGNGTIASLGLTTEDGGIIGIGSDTLRENNKTYMRGTYSFRSGDLGGTITASPISNTRFSLPLYFDFENGCIYLYDSTHIIRIYLEYPFVNLFHLKNVGYGSGKTKVDSLSISAATVGCLAVSEDGTAYIAKSTTWNSGANMTFYKVKLSDFTLTEITVKNSTGEGIRASAGNNARGGRVYSIAKNHLYVVGNSTGTVYAINLQNNDDVKTVKKADGSNAKTSASTSYPGAFYGALINGCVVFGRSQYGCYNGSATPSEPLSIINPDTYIARYIGSYPYGWFGNSVNDYIYGCDVFNTTNKAIIGYAQGQNGNSSETVRIQLNPCGLVTINNLDTPVVKTADQTMRVTYTITEE